MLWPWLQQLTLFPFKVANSRPNYEQIVSVSGLPHTLHNWTSLLYVSNITLWITLTNFVTDDHLRKLIVIQPVMKSPAFKKVGAALSCSEKTTIGPNVSQFNLFRTFIQNLRSILILSSNPRQRLSHSLFPSGFPIKTSNTFLISLMPATYSSTNNIRRRVQIIKCLIV